MACSKTLTLNPVSEGDVPLEQAIYSPANDAIYGVRGGWVHKFNATTGALISSSVFSSDAIGPASITELAGVIYVCSWATSKLPEIPAFRDNHDIFSIDANTLASTNTQIWKTYNSSFDTKRFQYGPLQLTNDGTRLWGLVGQGTPFNPFYVIPSTPLGLKTTGSFSSENGGGPSGGELIWDDANFVAVFACQDGPTISSWDMSGGFPPNMVDDTAVSFSKQVVGLCYCPDTDKYYAVDNTSIVVTLEAADFRAVGAIGSINTGEALANPRRIKFNPNTGYLYVPGWASNSVIVIDPVLETVVEIQTGFNQPWDVVITPTKMFAVQNAPIGLREIT